MRSLLAAYCSAVRWYSSTTIMPWLTSRWNGSAVGTCPRSYSTLCQNRAYSRCSTACSTPPTYRSTPPVSVLDSGPIQYFSLAGSTSLASLLGSTYRSSYQDEPAHCGIVLVSRLYFFGPSPRSRVTSTHSVARDSGASGRLSASSGS